MLIVNQTKSILVNFDKLEAIVVDTKQTGCIISGFFLDDDGEVILGKYKSKGRTLEIMNDIALAYAENAKTFIMPLD